MAYSLDFRRCAVDVIRGGMTWREAFWTLLPANPVFGALWADGSGDTGIQYCPDHRLLPCAAYWNSGLNALAALLPGMIN